MKNDRFLILLFMSYLSNPVFSQNVGINDDSSFPNASAMLHVQSTTRGLLVPRMTTVQRSAIASPATGLLVFDSDTESFWFMETFGWIELVAGNITTMADDDDDTRIQVEEAPDEDIIRFDLAGSERWVMEASRLWPNNTGSSVFIGENAGASDDLTLNQNVFIGYNSGNSNTTGLNNTALGTSTLESNVDGNYNVAIGFNSLNANISGDYNVAIGNNNLQSSTGSDNTAIGRSSQATSSTGIYNSSLGSLSFNQLTTGSYNTAVGYLAGYNVLTSTNSTYIGREADQTLAGSTLANSMALGYNAKTTASNQVRIGNTSVTDIGGYASWTDLSDARFKRNILNDVPGLDFILKLRPVTYQIDLPTLNQFLGIDAEDERQERITGFMAQEVEMVANQIGFDFSGVVTPNSDNEHYGLRYSKFVVPLVKAIQEQQRLINELSLRIVQLEQLRLPTSELVNQDKRQ
ncbi:MAG: tail fiber domain-containing protein [Ekhidna sp.]|uniref:tail fiber domain-containing protein n=1 Tax=Ekhidna sp. TaxID=2608089 RepID=UPI0032ED3D35